MSAVSSPVNAMDVSSVDEGEEMEGNPYAALRPLTESPAFVVVQVAFALALGALVDAGFSGDWQALGVLSDAVAGTARQACYVAAAAHAALAGASAFIATSKGFGLAPAAMTLVTGPLGFLKVAAMFDREELEAIAANNAPSLSMAISTLELSQRQTPSAVVLTTSIKSKKGREGAMRKLLETLVGDTIEGHKDLVMTCTVNQDPEDRTSFFMLQRFPSPDAMSDYQNTESFRAFTDGAEGCIVEPMGLYMVNERSGKMGEAVHPFGPGGEGGRDDAIYSSPANLQGSQSPGF
ncbi:unnamed protein product [Ascophyllum nodosum]